MKKITATFNHLGFPIQLVNWPHIEIDGELVPDVNYQKLEDLMFEMLPQKPTKLTGAEIKFIRHYMDMTQKQFAKWLEDETDASTIAVWEKADLEPTNMSKAMERSLRIQLITHNLEKRRKTTVKINLNREISHRISKKSKPIELPAKSFFPIPKHVPKDLAIV
jgi:DNA-binding transcriptional regulator YiaG